AGADVAFLGAVGDDVFGPQLRATLVDNGIDVSGLRTVGGASGIAHIVVDREGNDSIIVIPGANGTVTGLRENDPLLLDGAQALLLQLETPLSGVIAAARAGRSLGVTTVLTPAPAQPLPQELLECVDVLLPNQYEAATITGEDTPE